ncbi:MAG TPA: glycosyltransferase, partial [Bacteroidetes bacterium]|nr:glycosyltransferase [Bacteroidota bacterium]
MKILLVNKFLYPKGGDAISTLSTGKLLFKKGHSVIFWGMKHPNNPQYLYSEYFVDNIDYVGSVSAKRKVSEAFKILYSFEARRKIDRLIQSISPDIVHINNFAHQISPSILDIFKKYNIPVVMTLRDYKLVCPTYSMLLDGKPCDKCKNGRYYNCFLNKCTKASYSKSLLNTIEMYLHHKILHIYDQIDVIIATSQFLKEKHIEMGLSKPIICLPNFVTVEEFLPQYHSKAKSIVYFGRLSREKGLFTLLDAVKGLNVQLKIIGEGDLKRDLEEKAKIKGIKNVSFLGYKSGEDLKEEIMCCSATIIPSECYEAFGRTIIESFALGKPVIGSRIGGIPELVKDGKTGYTFTPSD